MHLCYPKRTMRRTPLHRQAGFTLPELFVSVGLVLLILVLLMVFVHPRDYSVQNRNNQRRVDIAQIIQALNRYYAQNGKLPDGLTKDAQFIGNSADDGIDLCKSLVPAFAKELPVDPKDGLKLPTGVCIAPKEDPTLYAYESMYSIKRADDGTVTVAAPSAEGRQSISLSHKY
jgi:type II secretory pathway pseudopilin PulG